jgi:hypothetical protein
MRNILFCHGCATKYVKMNGIKKLKKLIYTNNVTILHGALQDHQDREYLDKI